MPFVRYIKVWYLMTVNSFSAMLISRLGGVLFISGKLLRFFFFLIFLLLLTRQTQALAGYGVLQVVLLFLTFNLIDTISQFLFREVYRFRHLVVSGNFDLVLVKPINPLFRALLGGADPFDLLMIFPFIFATFYVTAKLQPAVTEVVIYLLLLASGFGIAVAFHIFVLALGIITTEIDHAIMIYRDVTSAGRVPIDIYHGPIRALLTFIIPVGVMVTFPAKALFGLLSPLGILLSLAMSASFLFLSLRFWQYALSQYASASS